MMILILAIGAFLLGTALITLSNHLIKKTARRI